MKHKLKHTYALIDKHNHIRGTYKLDSQDNVSNLKRSRSQLERRWGKLTLVKLYYKKVDKG
jgi:hypothetical protein